MAQELDDFLAFTYAERHGDLTGAPAVDLVIFDTDVASLLHRHKLARPQAARLIEQPDFRTLWHRVRDV
jgi:hypothetical protein